MTASPYDTPLSAIREHAEKCPICHGQVLPGQSEGMITEAGWCHTDCVVSAQRQAQG